MIFRVALQSPSPMLSEYTPAVKPVDNFRQISRKPNVSAILHHINQTGKMLIQRSTLINQPHQQCKPKLKSLWSCAARSASTMKPTKKPSPRWKLKRDVPPASQSVPRHMMCSFHCVVSKLRGDAKRLARELPIIG